MLFKVRCRPAFATLFVTLNPGEKITVKMGSIISMDGEVTVHTGFCGSWLSAIVRKCFGGTDIFVDYLTNETEEPITVGLSQTTIGDIERIDLSQGPICLQPRVLLAYTKGVKIENHWGGFGSWLVGDGLFKTKCKGKGRVFIGAYGGIIKKTIYQDLMMAQGHLLAYQPTTPLNYRKEKEKVNITVSGVKNRNKRTQGTLIYVQSRTLQGLINYLRSLV
ncbi:hypothetical protein cce_1312 [Crocosphaera subtropica ATCC 51142]|uniref:Uncharacterized protein n=1 Tax=Crocosphaera subtropica (strain ATCC 51142 / BH68) TaxID=43989 RepID=B1WVS5_CROS5|nr:TIGR00266 family protein [Crocosphaera subtropica]ACB50662.1 hypothetical protein cce_1312 [Crocosphaera subtropica ATCC 51142]